MLENRNVHRDLFAIGLLAFVIFLAVSLISYQPADPVEAPANSTLVSYTPDHLVHPRNESVTNLCGYWGALTADLLLSGMGIGAYFLVGSLAWVDYTLLRRRATASPWLRTFGWVITLVGLTTLAALILPNFSIGPVVGPGGYLGTLCGALLQTQFATIGAVILSTSILFCGLLLYTDYGILRVLKCGLGITVAGASAIRSRGKRSLADGEEQADEWEEEQDEDGESSLSVKIRGKRVDRDADADAEEESEEEWSEEDAEEEELAEAEAEPSEESDEDEGEEGEQEEEPQEPRIVKKQKSSRKKKSQVHKGPHFKIEKKPGDEREDVMQKLDAASQTDLLDEYELPDVDLLISGDDVSFADQEQEVRRKARILEKTFGEFGFKVKVVEIETGPVIAQYEIQLEAGLRLSKITGLADDLAIALRVPSVRIVAPIPGKNTVGIEVPNEVRQVVRLRDVMEEADHKTRKMNIPLFLGKDVSGNPLTADLASLPHLLIAGRTGTGKSVCLNAIISSILMTRRPDEVRMLMIDPKMVELSGYGRLPHLMHPVVTDMKKAEAILAWAVEKMEERYALLAKAGVRHISTYNQLGEDELVRRLDPEDDEQRQAIPLHLPFIVIVADEMADLMMTAGKEVEQHIIRLAQKSRAVGIHLILATQKPTVDVITGLIKSNLPARICFQVASRTDSRVVLDEMGADKLLGNGDMLFLWPGTSTLLRGQGTFLSDDEIDAVTAEVSTGEQNFVNELVNLKVTEEGEGDGPTALKKRDELYESAVDIVVREGRGSVSLLQRSLGIGYGRAARLIDFMAEDNIVGAYAGSQAREVLISMDEWNAMQGLDEEETESQPPPKRSNRIAMDDSSFDTEDEPEAAPSGWTVHDPADDEDAEEEYDDNEEEDEEVEAYSPDADDFAESDDPEEEYDEDEDEDEEELAEDETGEAEGEYEEEYEDEYDEEDEYEEEEDGEEYEEEEPAYAEDEGEEDYDEEYDEEYDDEDYEEVEEEDEEREDAYP